LVADQFHAVKDCRQATSLLALVLDSIVELSAFSLSAGKNITKAIFDTIF